MVQGNDRGRRAKAGRRLHRKERLREKAAALGVQVKGE